MLTRVISGGQTGADQAGWRAAKAAGIATGGWMPRGFKTEAGPRPQFAELYGAKEHPSPDYPARRLANLKLTGKHGGRECGLAVVFDATPPPKMSPGTRGLLNDFDAHIMSGTVPYVTVVHLVKVVGGFKVSPKSHDPEGLAWAIGHCYAEALLVAGNRESSAPGIGAWVETYLAEVFRLLKEAR